MTSRRKLDRMVASPVSSMCRAVESGIAGIVWPVQVLITQSYWDLPECRHSRSRRNSGRESRQRELSDARVLVYVWQT